MDLHQRPAVRVNNPFLALRHRNFRLYTTGMLISTIGTWMQSIAQPWLAYSLTKSPFLLSLVGALQFTPVLLFSLFAGVVIDKYPRKTLIIITQAASLLITLPLAILAWTGQVQYWHILVLAIAQGFVNTLDIPARQSFVVELVSRDDLMNAIALNSTVFNLSRVIGPALAGIIMAVAGVAMCFALNAISFAAVLVSLFFIKPLPIYHPPKPSTKALAEIREGLRYIRSSRVLMQTLILIAILGTFVPNFSVLVPVFATDILQLNETGFAFLMSFLGIGSLGGALYIAAISHTGPRRWIMRIVPLIVSIGMLLTGLTRTFILTGLLLAVTGFFFVAFNANATSTLQMNASDEYRGRVMSVYTLIFGGSTPIGNLYAGVIADRVSAGAGFIACGAIMLPLLVLVMTRRHQRPAA